MTAFYELSACELAAGRARGEWTTEEVVQAHLDRITDRNPRINAFCTLAADTALAQAREQDQLTPSCLGPLAGVPVAVKDVTETGGIRTTFGSVLMKDNIPQNDALIVSQLKQHGAIIIGKTNTPEFAAGANTKNELFGATVNPWDPTRTVGGSTGGGAAALADFMAPLAEGTDFGGSLRVPASFCGVVGLRPTAGLTSSHPVAQPWDVGRVNGPMARTATDVALMLSAIVGLEDLSPISTPTGWDFPPQELPYKVAGFCPAETRLKYVADLSGLGIDTAVAETCEAALGMIESGGLAVRHKNLSLADAHEAYKTLRSQWMVANYYAYLDRIEELNPALRSNIEAGLTVSSLAIAEAKAKQKEAWSRMLEALQECDVIATPTVPIPPFPVEWGHPESINGQPLHTYVDWLAQTYLVTLTGFPAVSVPVGLDRNGLPVGLQLVGRRFSEPLLLGLAHHIQQVIPPKSPAT